MKPIKKAVVSAYIDIKIPFNDVDMMRVAWHGNYLKYLEDARCVLLDKIAYNYFEMEASGMMWPIVDTRLKYIKSAHFGQTIRVHAGLVEYENRLKIDYVIEDPLTGDVLTKAYSIQVAIDEATQELQFCAPDKLINNVNAYLANENNSN